MFRTRLLLILVFMLLQVQVPLEVCAYDLGDFEFLQTTGNCMGCDLTEIDLSEAFLAGVDLSGADLSEADLSGADLKNAVLSGAFLKDADLSRADLLNADLSGADLTGANLAGATWTDGQRCSQDSTSGTCKKGP
jgi:uncharacterized protein YjbI with pentapeptide repeats